MKKLTFGTPEKLTLRANADPVTAAGGSHSCR